MSAILLNYEYDIFISYRQKDNRSDQWVTQFVQALKEELDATFKEDISVYFDENPHDGLHDTHDVDDSLKEKVKCLIFIPIVSRTYCDPKSFAWQKEFLPFLEFAKKDEYGLKVKLANGNVTSRVLPIRIHDLDTEDVKLFEKETGSVIRSIDFVYKEAGVNRPLRPKIDDPSKNQNHTVYRDQINKVANAIKEILQGIKNYDYASNDIVNSTTTTNPVTSSISAKSKTKKALVFAALSVIIAVIIYFAFIQKNVSVPIDKETEKSIAVLPFKNLSEKSENQHFADGMMEDILNQLSKIRDFNVTSRTSSDKYRNNTEKSIVQVAEELGVSYILQGSVQRDENNVRISVQLVDAFNDRNVWADNYDRQLSLSSIFAIQTEISKKIAEVLQATLSPKEEQFMEYQPTTNLEAYDFYLKGRESLNQWWLQVRENDLKTAIQLLKTAIKLDPDMAISYVQLGNAYRFKHLYHGYEAYWLDSALILADKAITMKQDLPESYHLKGWTFRAKALNIEMKEAFEKFIELSPETADSYDIMAVLAQQNGQMYERLKYSELALKFDPKNPIRYTNLGIVYDNLHLYEMAETFYKEALVLQPNYIYANQRLSYIYYARGDQKKSVRYAVEALTFSPESLWALHNAAEYNACAGNFSQAEKYYKQIIKITGQENYKESVATPPYRHRYGYVLWQTNRKEEAKKLFEEQLKISAEQAESELAIGSNYYYDLAGINAILGNIKEANNWLEKIPDTDIFWHGYIQHDPLFDNLRTNDQFKQKLSKWKSQIDKMQEHVRLMKEEENLKQAVSR